MRRKNLFQISHTGAYSGGGVAKGLFVWHTTPPQKKEFEEKKKGKTGRNGKEEGKA